MQHGIDDVKAWSVIKIISCDNNFLFYLFFPFVYISQMVLNNITTHTLSSLTNSFGKF